MMAERNGGCAWQTDRDQDGSRSPGSKLRDVCATGLESRKARRLYVKQDEEVSYGTQEDVMMANICFDGNKF